MINRELIRVKTVQLVYANIVNNGKDLEEIIKEMEESLTAAYELYHHMLALICDITDYAAQRYELICSHLQERGITNLPSSRFIDNKFANQLQDNAQLERFLNNHKKLRWTTHEDVVHAIYKHITDSKEYEEYMDAPATDYEADRNLWRKLYKNYIYQNELVDEALEDSNIFWNDDRYIIDTFVMKTIKRFSEENGVDQPLLEEYNSNEDHKFGRDLLARALNKRSEYEALIRQHIRNWDFSRQANIDIAILTTALAEIMTYPGIALNVSFNEYINIAKMYGAPKSANFINATLDSIVRDLKAEGKLLK